MFFLLLRASLQHFLSRGGTVVFSGRCAEAHEDPRKVVDPVRRGPVRLRVVGGGLIVLDVEEAAEGGPQGGGELGPAV